MSQPNPNPTNAAPPPAPHRTPQTQPQTKQKIRSPLPFPSLSPTPDFPDNPFASAPGKKRRKRGRSLGVADDNDDDDNRSGKKGRMGNGKGVMFLSQAGDRRARGEDGEERMKKRGRVLPGGDAAETHSTAKKRPKKGKKEQVRVKEIRDSNFYWPDGNIVLEAVGNPVIYESVEGEESESEESEDESIAGDTANSKDKEGGRDEDRTTSSSPPSDSRAPSSASNREYENENKTKKRFRKGVEVVVYFRVHQSIVVHYANGFRSLFEGLPGDMVGKGGGAMYDGVPLIEVDDDADDLRAFLGSVYPMRLEFFKPRYHPDSARSLIGPLILAKKYGGEMLKEKILKHLRGDWPAESFEEWMKRDKAIKLACRRRNQRRPDGNNNKEDMDGEEKENGVYPDPEDLIHLAWETRSQGDFQKELALAYYILSCHGTGTWDLELLRKEDLMRVVEGRRVVDAWVYASLKEGEDVQIGDGIWEVGNNVNGGGEGGWAGGNGIETQLDLVCKGCDVERFRDNVLLGWVKASSMGVVKRGKDASKEKGKGVAWGGGGGGGATEVIAFFDTMVRNTKNGDMKCLCGGKSCKMIVVKWFQQLRSEADAESMDVRSRPQA